MPFLLSRTPKQRGPYNDAFDKIKASGQRVEIVYVPPARAELLYQQKKVNCLFPGSLENMEGKHQMIESNPLATVHAYVFSLEEKDVKPDIKAQRIAIRRGFSFDSIRKKLNAEFIDVNSEVVAIQFLLKQRVDAIVSYLSDLQGAQQALNLTTTEFYKSTSIYAANEAFICHNTSKNNDFVRKVNALFPKTEKLNSP
ncbi:hypothetical protein GCM10009114_14020 [Aliiglaciecola litoralis]|uniref:Solute-binding protein family 3/N-terminal domain-containing protein n=2 Tax=Aliiglaciecola litoralis TaxID=582857 RepID=A0ABN1LFN8_9ALTE